MHRLLQLHRWPYLSRLRSLNLGYKTGQFVMDWRMAPVQVPFTHLRITVHERVELLRIIATKPLCKTLRQLHVKTRDVGTRGICRLSDVDAPLRMPSLHTFTFMKPLHCEDIEGWPFIDMLTSSEVMPALKRIQFIAAATAADLQRIDQSMLFNDDRNVDVHFAILLNDNQCHIELSKRVSLGSRSHPRSRASATYYKNMSDDDWKQKLPDGLYFRDGEGRFHLWYTFPWAFNDFLQICVPDACITEVQVSDPSPWMNIRSQSRLRTMHLIRNGRYDTDSSSIDYHVY